MSKFGPQIPFLNELYPTNSRSVLPLVSHPILNELKVNGILIGARGILLCTTENQYNKEKESIRCSCKTLQNHFYDAHKKL